MLRKLVFIGAAIASAMVGQTIYVDDNANPGGDGSATFPFQNLPAAVREANARNFKSKIQLAPGRYELNETLRIERGMSIVGSGQPQLDGKKLPTGLLQNGASESLIVSSPTMTQLMIFVGKDGEVIRDVKFEQLTLESGAGRPNIVDFARVQDFEVRECIFRGPAGPLTGTLGSAINTYASSGRIRSNYMTRLGGAAFLSAGNGGSPANVVFEENRAVGNRVGVFLVGTSDGIPEQGDQLDVEIRKNDISDNFALRPSAGIRMVVKGNESLTANGTLGLATGNIRVEIRENRLVGNKVGIIIDGGFVTRQVPGVTPAQCDTRVFRGQVDLKLQDNEVAGSTFQPSIISFTQYQATLGILENSPANYTNSQFLHFSKFRIEDKDNSLALAKVHHPAVDPYIGTLCSADAETEALHNELWVNGSLVSPAPTVQTLP